MSDTLREVMARAINKGLGPSWAYSNWKGNEYKNCRHMLDDATDAALAAIKDAGYAVVPVEPTEAMLMAVPLLVAGIDPSYSNHTLSRKVYKIMLEAAKETDEE
jgi:hypothetical protein